MSYKTILLYLENEAQAPSLVKCASSLASQHGAHLIALFVVHPLQLYVGRAGGVGISSEYSALLAKEQLDRAHRLQRIFEQATQQQEIVAEWRMIDERVWPVEKTVLQEATTADLLVVGNQKRNFFSPDIVDDFLLSSPVPILVVPDKLQNTNIGQDILVAWDGSNEAARAVRGARPILRSAENVWVEFVRTSTDKDKIMDSNLQDLTINLSRHGVKAEMNESVVGLNEVGKSVFATAKDRGVDCVVMGAYGHSKIRNILLGNTTDYALNNTQMPLLMWH